MKMVRLNYFYLFIDFKIRIISENIRRKRKKKLNFIDYNLVTHTYDLDFINNK